MARERRAALAAALLLALVVVLEFLPALSLGFAGDDFELLSLARIGGFSPSALVLPHRGAFVKPVLNAAWAASAALLGASAGAWYTLALLVHLLDATLLGLLACRLVAAWQAQRGAEPAENAAFEAAQGEARSARDAADARAWTKAPALSGLLAALIWAVHDRLAEPVFSIASLNHSLTFALYLAAMLAAAGAIATRSARARLLTALFVLLTLFSYEVGASVVLALGLLVLFAPGEAAAPSAASTPGTDRAAASTAGLRRRASALGLPTAAVVLVWAIVQGISRLAPGAVSYYTFSPALWLSNLGEMGLAFVHIPSYRIAPGAVWTLPFAGALLAGALWPRLDRVVRFGCAWALAASLPVLPIPFFSDRYHYIVFAGIAIALGRGAALLVDRAVTADATAAAAPRRARAFLAIVAVLFLTHTAWSVLGAREQATYYAVKNGLSEILLDDARARDDDAAAQGSSVLAVVWRGDSAAYGAWLQAAEARLNPRFSETHPIYVRPGILGAVYPADLFNVAAADRDAFYRRPSPGRAAQALAQGLVRVVDVGATVWGTHTADSSPQDERRGLSPETRAQLAARLRDALMTRRAIPMTLSYEPAPSAPGWNVAWLEPTDRAGAFEAEYGPAAAASERASTLAGGSAATPAPASR